MKNQSNLSFHTVSFSSQQLFSFKIKLVRFHIQKLGSFKRIHLMLPSYILDANHNTPKLLLSSSLSGPSQFLNQ
jgi:hypothetical protein